MEHEAENQPIWLIISPPLSCSVYLAHRSPQVCIDLIDDVCWIQIPIRT